MAETRIGISGWTYAGWRGVFYPEGLAHRRELEYASRQLSSIEINGTFYSLQLPGSFERWREETPDDFLFSIKGSRFITHMKQLRDVEIPLANFFASGVLALGAKLGPFLWQFPERLRFNAERFEHFLQILPRTTIEAAALAEQHDERLNARSYTWTDADRPLRHAIEVRHPSFLVPGFIALLRAHNTALVFSDSGGLWAYAEDLTADFVYARLHGSETLYTSGYSDEEIDSWAKRMRCWRRAQNPRGAPLVVPDTTTRARELDAYVYFDNDAKVHAPFDALRLARKLGAKRAPSREKQAEHG